MNNTTPTTTAAAAAAAAAAATTTIATTCFTWRHSEPIPYSPVLRGKCRPLFVHHPEFM